MRRWRTRTSRFIRKTAPVALVAMLLAGTLGLLPRFSDGVPERAPWSKCGLALCSCLMPLEQEPVCPLCPGYDGPEPQTQVVVSYNASLQAPLALLLGSFGLVIVLARRADDVSDDPDERPEPAHARRTPRSRTLAHEPPPPKKTRA
ncbi:MAG: hypothetical protein ACF8Q5_12180 [Phycisphaerales bacterium JB040]